MKSLKMLVSVATMCLLVGASSTAIAQTVTDCPDGVIEGTKDAPLTVSEIAIVGQSCVIRNVDVTGDASVINGEDVSFLDNTVAGTVRIRGTRNATVIGNTVDKEPRRKQRGIRRVPIDDLCITSDTPPLVA